MIESAAGSLDPAKRYNLTLQHGSGTRELRNAQVRAFQPYMPIWTDRAGVEHGSDEFRYEAEGELGVPQAPSQGGGIKWEPMTVGIVLDQVVSAEEAK